MNLVIGLTGGIGTGKSSVLAVFKRLGAAAISLDEMSHRLSFKGEPLYGKIVQAVGSRFLGPMNEIDRRALGKAVFSSPPLRRRLEKATHPTLLKEMDREIRGSRRRVTVVDVPLLFEKGLQDRFHATIVVSAPRKDALRRLLRRDGLRRTDALLRMGAQMPLVKKENLGDIVLENRGTLGELEKKVREYYQAFDLIAKSRTGSTTRGN